MDFLCVWHRKKVGEKGVVLVIKSESAKELLQSTVVVQKSYQVQPKADKKLHSKDAPKLLPNCPLGTSLYISKEKKWTDK